MLSKQVAWAWLARKIVESARERSRCSTMGRGEARSASPGRATAPPSASAGQRSGPHVEGRGDMSPFSESEAASIAGRLRLLAETSQAFAAVTHDYGVF